MSKTAIGSYKGSATLSLDSDSKYPFTFGVKKARLILECLPQIQAFVASNGTSTGPAPVQTPASTGAVDPGNRFDQDVEDMGARQCGLIQ